ncbi:MAG: CapA family protein [Chloroflexota bacterium]
MNAPAKRRDWSSLLAFGIFWIVVAVGCLIAYQLVNALGLPGARSTAAARAPKHLHRVRPSGNPPRFTVASIFAPKPVSLARYQKHKLRTIIATGDVIPGRSVNYKMVTYNDFLYPFRRTAGYLRNADLTLINLESPLISGCLLTDSGMSFCGDPRATQGFTYAGIDVACTANNHIGNYGSPGIQETWQHLTAAGIAHCGLGAIAYKSVRGLRFAFLAYNAVGQRFDYTLARQEIHEARKHAAVVIVSVHWGKEYVPVPSIAPGIADDDPVRIAHWIIDSGADLIIGNHPHHVQGVEMYHGHLITYAHGNFAFDQMFTVSDCPGDANRYCSTREGVVGKYTFYGRKLVSVRYKPLVIYDYAQPRWADPAVGRAILSEMKRSTRELARTGR